MLMAEAAFRFTFTNLMIRLEIFFLSVKKRKSTSKPDCLNFAHSYTESL